MNNVAHVLFGENFNPVKILRSKYVLINRALNYIQKYFKRFFEKKFMVFITRSVCWENAQKGGMNHTVFRIRDAVTAVKIWFRVTVKAQLIVYRNSSSRDKKIHDHS